VRGVLVLVRMRIDTEESVGGMPLQCVATGMVWLILLILYCYKRGVREAQRARGFVTVI
jgi:hypothetical protein